MQHFALYGPFIPVYYHYSLFMLVQFVIFLEIKKNIHFHDSSCFPPQSL